MNGTRDFEEEATALQRRQRTTDICRQALGLPSAFGTATAAAIDSPTRIQAHSSAPSKDSSSPISPHQPHEKPHGSVWPSTRRRSSSALSTSSPRTAALSSTNPPASTSSTTGGLSRQSTFSKRRGSVRSIHAAQQPNSNDPKLNLKGQEAIQAVLRDDADTLRTLLQVVDLNFTNKGGQTLLDLATQRRKPKARALLQEMQAKATSPRYSPTKPDFKQQVGSAHNRMHLFS